MSTVNGVNYTIASSPTPSTLLDAGKYGGRVRVYTDTYEALTLASGSTISVCSVPANSVFVYGLVVHDALGANTTLSVGDSGNVARFAAAESTVSAGDIECRAIDGINYQFSSDTVITLTNAGSTGIVTGTIKTVFMVSDG